MGGLLLVGGLGPGAPGPPKSGRGWQYFHQLHRTVVNKDWIYAAHSSAKSAETETETTKHNPYLRLICWKWQFFLPHSHLAHPLRGCSLRKFAIKCISVHALEQWRPRDCSLSHFDTIASLTDRHTDKQTLSYYTALDSKLCWRAVKLYWSQIIKKF